MSWVSLLLLALAVSGGYLAWVWGPVYFVHVEAKTVVRDYMNQAIKNQNDDALVLRMTQRLAALDEVNALDEDGTRVKVPAVDVKPEDVSWTRDADATPPTLRVAFTYRRNVEFPFLNRWVEHELSIDLTQDLARADWGPAR